MTNTSREMGAVFGVAVLGAVVNARLTGDLASRLRALGIPPQFQSLVIKAVTTGTVPKGAGGGGGADQGIVAQVIHVAYSAFGSGLDVALTLSGAMLLAGAVVAFTTTAPERGGRSPGGLKGACGRNERRFPVDVLPGQDDRVAHFRPTGRRRDRG